MVWLSPSPHSQVGPTQPNFHDGWVTPGGMQDTVPGGNSTMATALWSCEKLTGPKETARFLGGSLIVILCNSGRWKRISCFRVWALKTWSTSLQCIGVCISILCWWVDLRFFHRNQGELRNEAAKNLNWCSFRNYHFSLFVFSSRYLLSFQGAREQFEGYYRKQRRKQARLALQPPPNLVQIASFHFVRQQMSLVSLACTDTVQQNHDKERAKQGIVTARKCSAEPSAFSLKLRLSRTLFEMSMGFTRSWKHDGCWSRKDLCLEQLRTRFFEWNLLLSDPFKWSFK